MNKIFVAILSFLVILFPGCQYLQAQHQMASYDREKVQSAIISAIEARNISVLESMMCKKIRSETKDLSAEIRTFLDSIDGEIAENEGWVGTKDYDKRDFFTKISTRSWEYNFQTTTLHNYSIHITWVIINTSSPEWDILQEASHAL
jgi:hypothetical protein